MTAFIGPNQKFMETTIKPKLQQIFTTLFMPSQSPSLSLIFNFETKLEGKKSFESLYFVFLDTFQSAGYGDELFSRLVMVPLAQRYNVKWRKRVWSEHVAVLRFITCSQNEVSYYFYYVVDSVNWLDS